MPPSGSTTWSRPRVPLLPQTWTQPLLEEPGFLPGRWQEEAPWGQRGSWAPQVRFQACSVRIVRKRAGFFFLNSLISRLIFFSLTMKISAMCFKIFFSNNSASIITNHVIIYSGRLVYSSLCPENVSQWKHSEIAVVPTEERASLCAEAASPSGSLLNGRNPRSVTGSHQTSVPEVPSPETDLHSAGGRAVEGGVGGVSGSPRSRM